MQKVVLIGGLGRVARIIYKGLSDKYEFVVIDLHDDEHIPVTVADIADYDSLLKAIPGDTDIIFDLTAYNSSVSQLEQRDFDKMNQTYVRGIYNVFEVAKALNIPKVIYSSSLHATGLYEKDGLSLLGRKIRETDYPKPDCVYGAMKLFGESIARLYSLKYNIKVICFRYGMITANNYFYKKMPRNRRIFLYHEDLIKIVAAAFESQIDFAIFNAVSKNAQRPWSLRNLRKGLKLNQRDFIKKKDSSFAHKVLMNFLRIILRR